MLERGEMKKPLFAWWFGFALVSGLVTAEENTPSLKDALKELEAAYDRNPGYIAAYQGKGKDASLEYQMAVDRVSNLTVSKMVLINGGDRSDCRIWNTGDDRWYFATRDELRIARGLSEEITSLMELVRKVTKAEAEIPKTCQSLLLERGGLSTGLCFKTGAPPWLSVLEESTVRSADPDSITFETTKHGNLTMSRASGLLIRQSLVTEKGNERILELKECKRNPGRKAVEDMVRDWPTLGAKSMNVGPIMAPMRLKLFRFVIDSVEQGAADLGKLEGVLEEQKDATRRFVKCCVENAADSPAMERWKNIPFPSKEKWREVWLKDFPGSDANDEEGFRKFLNSTKVRSSFREKAVAVFLNHESAVDKLTADLLGEGVWEQLKTNDEAGQAAKEIIGKSLARTYVEVMMERLMNQRWGDPAGLE